MTGYVRQQFYADEDTILAEHSNDEFDLIEQVFDAITGHTHDGDAGEGGLISTIQDGDGDTKIVLEETPDEDAIHLYAAGTKKVSVDNAGLNIGGRFLLAYNSVDDTLDISVV